MDYLTNIKLLVKVNIYDNLTGKVFLSPTNPLLSILN